MSQLRPSQEREREEIRKRRRLERKKDEDFVLVQLIHFILYFILFYFYESIFISFRCSLFTSVHHACGSLQFFFFLKKVLGVCFNKDGDFVLVQLIHFIFFFYLMKLYLFHLDVASPNGFSLHVYYYFLSCWFFLG